MRRAPIHLPAMKKLLPLSVAAALLVFASATFAAEQNAAAAKPATKEKSKPAAQCEACKDDCKCEKGRCKCDEKKEKRVLLTGSHIPQRVTKVGRITNGISPVVVYTASDLESTGESDVAAALRKLSPAFR